MLILICEFVFPLEIKISLFILHIAHSFNDQILKIPLQNDWCSCNFLLVFG
jgi:hypothetical protein